MKNIQHKLILFVFIVFTFSHSSFSQDDLAFELGYEVNRIYPSISAVKSTLTEAHTLADLNSRYQSSWVKEYVSVEVLTTYKGSIRKAMGENDVLNQEQKDIIRMADVGTDISVKVQYLPENTLTHNDIKEIDFTITIDPEEDAGYVGGQQALMQYLKDNVADKIADSSFRQYHLTAVKFAINEEGQIIDAHVFESSKDEKVDELLLKAIRNMPCWKPAEYANGLKTKQEFVLTAGDHSSCVINFFNLRRDID